MDHLNPVELITEVLKAAEKKANLAIKDMLLRGFLAGALLAYATSLAQLVWSQGLPPVMGAVIFPVGFVLLALLGLELATGSFGLLPPGVMAGQVRLKGMLRNWSWVYIGNLIGSVFLCHTFRHDFNQVRCGRWRCYR